MTQPTSDKTSDKTFMAILDMFPDFKKAFLRYMVLADAAQVLQELGAETIWDQAIVETLQRKAREMFAEYGVDERFINELEKARGAEPLYLI